MAEKTSPPPYNRSGVAGAGAPEELGAGAPEELIPDDRLLQKDQDQKSKQKGEIQQQENEKTTHHHMTRGASSSSSSSVSIKATIAPAEKGQKYSVKDKNKRQKDRAY